MVKNPRYRATLTITPPKIKSMLTFYASDRGRVCKIEAHACEIVDDFLVVNIEEKGILIDSFIISRYSHCKKERIKKYFQRNNLKSTDFYL